MSGQLSYTYQTPKGVAGSLFDISPYSIDSRVNGEASDDAMKFGMGVVQGAAPGTDVKVPAAADTADKFEGVALTGFTQQMNTAGEVKIYNMQTVGILRWGRAWVRVAGSADPAYGDSLYLIKSGSERGMFTNDSDSGANIAINGKFIGSPGTGGTAPAVIYNQKN